MAQPSGVWAHGLQGAGFVDSSTRGCRRLKPARDFLIGLESQRFRAGLEKLEAGFVPRQEGRPKLVSAGSRRSGECGPRLGRFYSPARKRCGYGPTRPARAGFSRRHISFEGARLQPCRNSLNGDASEAAFRPTSLPRPSSRRCYIGSRSGAGPAQRNLVNPARSGRKQR